MRDRVQLLAFFILVLLLSASARGAEAPWDWGVATPESQGMSSSKLEALRQSMAAHKTHNLLVIRNDQIVLEWYAPGYSVSKPHGTASMAKAIVGGMSLAVAITDGRISIDDPVSKFVPQWKTDPRKAKITIRQLGSHTSGLDDAEADGLAHDKLTGWKGDFWKRPDPPNDCFTIARDQASVIFEPGQKISYSNPGIGMLTYCVTATLRDSPVKDSRGLLRDRVMRPLGVSDSEWSVGYGKTYTVDGLPLVPSWGGGSYTPRSVARIGRLVLREGDWNGNRLLSKESVKAVTGDAGLPGDCGMGWWTNGAGRYKKIPRDACWGAGAGDQLLFVVPSLNLIMVRNGETIALPPADAVDVLEKYHDQRAHLLFEALVGAVER
jgi:CubicO group peptidase (beta-lactamase class C family)